MKYSLSIKHLLFPLATVFFSPLGSFADVTCHVFPTVSTEKNAQFSTEHGKEEVKTFKWRPAEASPDCAKIIDGVIPVGSTREIVLKLIEENCAGDMTEPGRKVRSIYIRLQNLGAPYTIINQVNHRYDPVDESFPYMQIETLWDFANLSVANSNNQNLDPHFDGENLIYKLQDQARNIAPAGTMLRYFVRCDL